MTISKKVLFTVIITSAVSITQAVSMKNFDINTLKPYQEQVQEDINKTIKDLNDKSPSGIFVCTHKNDAKIAYKKLKESFRNIRKELASTTEQRKNDPESIHLYARQQAEGFEILIYEPWKKACKTNYKQARKTGDWSWVTQQTIFIQENK
jgi:hypothetical protein